MDDIPKPENFERESSEREQIEELLHRVDVLPALDTRPEDEILGYDKDGIPN